MRRILKIFGISHEFENNFPIEKNIFIEKILSKMEESKHLSFLESVGIVNPTKSIFIGKVNNENFELRLRKNLFGETLNFSFAKVTIEENENHLIVKTQIYGTDWLKFLFKLLSLIITIFIYLKIWGSDQIWILIGLLIFVFFFTIKLNVKNLESLLNEHILYFSENKFINKFKEQIDSYWEIDEIERDIFLNDILKYANSFPESFHKDFNQIKFNKEIFALPLILEALSKDTDKWGQFFVDLFEDILITAEQSRKPNDILSNLSYIDVIQEDPRPFVLIIIEKLHRALNSDNLEIKLASIWTLPDYLDNNLLSNKDLIINELQEQLYNRNWKVRAVAYRSLTFAKLLPFDYKLPLKDKLMRLIYGERPII